VVMDHGRIAAEGSPAQLIAEHSSREVVELRFVALDHEDHSRALDGIGRVEVLPDRLLMYVDDGDAAVAEVHRRDVIPTSVLIRRSTLEDVFLRLTGRTLVD
jgi:lipooligosaccharide transport system ATP-binding protein